jgi:hypothetical protein
VRKVGIPKLGAAELEYGRVEYGDRSTILQSNQPSPDDIEPEQRIAFF